MENLLTYNRNEMRWRSQAKCAGYNTDEFFPAVGSNARFIHEFCETCPVVAECLDYALENQLDYGIWGGTSVNQRADIRAGRKAHPYAAVRN